MSNVISICPSKSLHFQSDLTGLPIVHPNLIYKMGFVVPNYLAHSKKIRGVRGENIKALASYSEEGSAPGGLDSFPVSVELELISSESQYDRVIAEAQQLEESVVILWMASWCRKCIYLKPKLEKLAADYYPRTKCRSNKMIEKIDFMLIPTRNLPIQCFKVTPRRLRYDSIALMSTMFHTSLWFVRESLKCQPYSCGRIARNRLR